MTPLATIAMPTYNRLATLRRALDSARSQDYGQLEIVVCDNASTDGTDAYLASVAREDPRVRVLRHPTNITIAPNFVAARRLAQGEFFMWLSDDDRIEPDYVRKCIATLERDPTAILANGQCVYHQGEVEIQRAAAAAFMDPSPAARVTAFYWSTNDNGLFHGVYRLAGMYDIPLASTFGSDWQFVAEVAARGRILACPKAVIHRRLGGMSQSPGYAEAMGVPDLFRRRQNPFLWLACSVFAQIASGEGAYGTMSSGVRLSLAARSAGIIVRRYCKPDWFVRLRERIVITATA